MRTPLGFLLLISGFLTPFLLNFICGENELNSIYYLMSLAPFLDLSLNSLVFEKVNPKSVIKFQLVIGVFSAIIFSKLFYFFLFVFSRQILSTIVNYAMFSAKHGIEKNLRIYLGLQLLISAILTAFFQIENSIIIITAINIIIVIISYRNLFTFLEPLSEEKVGNFFIKKSNLTIILGSFFISNLFIIIDKSQTIYLVLGLQTINIFTNSYHYFKHFTIMNINIQNFLNGLPYGRLYFFGSIAIFTVITALNLSTILVMIACIVFGEIIQIHIANKRILISDFNFIYRLLLIVFAQYLYILNILNIEALTLIIILFYYLISIVYGKIFILDSRSV